MGYKRITPMPVVEGGTGDSTLGSTQILIGNGTSGIASTSNATINTGTGAITLNSGTGALGISTDASATTVSIGTGGAAKTVSLGSTNTTSTTTVQSGSGGISVATSTNGTIALTSGTGAINIGTDANAKTITIGNTTTSTATNINLGTGNMTVASATGTLITQKSTGEMTRPLQPAFFYYQASNSSGVTGNNTTYTFGSSTALTKLFDQGNNCTTAGVFTAPVTGIYMFNACMRLTSITTAMTQGKITIGTSISSNAVLTNYNPGATIDNSGQLSMQVSGLIQVTASSTISVFIVLINGASNAAVIQGSSGNYLSYFSGYLVC
jgi:hypothetical protein